MEDSCNLSNSVDIGGSSGNNSLPDFARSIPVDVPDLPDRPRPPLPTSASSNSLLSQLPSPDSQSESSFNSSTYNSFHRKWLHHPHTFSFEYSIKTKAGDDDLDDINITNSSYCKQRRIKLGIAILLQNESSRDENLMSKVENFLFSHSPLLDSYVERLKVLVEKAYTNRTNFLMLAYDAYKELEGRIFHLLTSPRLHSPLWLSMVKEPFQYFYLIDIFMHQLMSLTTKYENRSHNYFMTTLLTAVLTHHLSWVPTIIPSGSNLPPTHLYMEKHTAKWLDLLTRSHPYNPLWAQLGDLHGAIGYPCKIAKTVVIGKNRDLIRQILCVLSYFIRCNDVEERVVADMDDNVSEVGISVSNDRKMDGDAKQNVEDCKSDCTKDRSEDSCSGCKISEDKDNEIIVNSTVRDHVVDRGVAKDEPCRISNFNPISMVEVIKEDTVLATSGVMTSVSRQVSWEGGSSLFDEYFNEPVSLPTLDQIKEGDVLSGDQIKESEVVSDQIKESEVVSDQIKESEVVSGDQIKESEVVSDQIKESEVVSDQIKESEVVLNQNKDRDVVSRYTNDVCNVNTEDHPLDLAHSVPLSIDSSPSLGVRWDGTEFAASLFAGCTEHYVPDFVLHGTTDRSFIPHVLGSDLSHSMQYGVLDEPIARSVCIIADTDKWTVSLYSSEQTSSPISCQTPPPSPMVSSLLDGLKHLWSHNISPDYCITHLEDVLKEVYFHSRTLVEYLRSHKCVKMCELASVLGFEESDLPLLVAVASTHSPHITFGL